MVSPQSVLGRSSITLIFDVLGCRSRIHPWPVDKRLHPSVRQVSVNLHAPMSEQLNAIKLLKLIARQSAPKLAVKLASGRHLIIKRLTLNNGYDELDILETFRGLEHDGGQCHQAVRDEALRVLVRLDLGAAHGLAFRSPLSQAISRVDSAAGQPILEPGEAPHEMR